MDRSDSEKWARASELLDQVLLKPESEREQAIIDLGTASGVLSELKMLVDGAQRSSVLDESLDDVVAKLPSGLVAQNALHGKQFGRWLLGDEIGRGGMSVVYHATRSGDGFEQHAAFKILSVAFLHEKHIESFYRERKILSELTHPGIARMIDGGVTGDGAPYLVMEKIDGDRIDTWCKNHDVDGRGVVQLMEQLSRAVAHAHQHLVVHRDINPSNILVDEQGRPILVDFGIAKLLNEVETGKTLQAFTPEYAAPEQREGKAITTATDVYGLGITLKKLLAEIRLDDDIKSIIHTATHHDTDLRYATAKGFGNDLRAWLENRPIVARPDSLAYRIRKFSVRNWQWMSLAGLALVIALAGVVSTGRQAQISRQEAEKHRAMADFTLDLFKQADLMQSGSDLRVTELLADAELQAKRDLAGQPEALVSLLALIASGQLELTNYDSASNALNEAHTIIESMNISPGTQSEYYVQRGREAYELGHFPDAVAHLQTAVDLLSQDAEPADQYFLVASMLVSYLVDAEKYDDALAIARRLDQEVKQYGAGQEARVSVMHRNAIALEVTGDTDSAFEQYEAALALQHEYQPDNQLGRAAILHDYGIGLYFADRLEESETIFREVLQIFNDNFEAPHPRISSAVHNLAFALVGQDELEEAIELQIQSYQMSVALHGPEHIDSLLEQVTLGTLLTRNGDYDRAEAIFRENILVLERVAPDQLVQRGSGHSYLGDLLLRTGRLEESRAEYLAALKLYESLPEDNVRVVEAKTRIEEIDQKKAVSDQENL